MASGWSGLQLPVVQSKNFCIFCLIARGQDEETEIISQNQELVCFRDIYPAAPHHYLVITRRHIHSCLSLKGKHVDLIKRMAEMGRAVLRNQGVTDMNDMSLGFHQPPYISVAHLHLHVLGPRSQIDPYIMYKFVPKTPFFILEKDLRERLQQNSYCIF